MSLGLKELNKETMGEDEDREEEKEEENLSFFEKIKKSFPSVKRKASDGSNSASSDDDRRDSLQSTLSLPAGVDLSKRRPSSASTFGNHGTFGPPFSLRQEQVMEGRAEKCPLTRCLSAREARLRKRGKSQKNTDMRILFDKA